MRRSRDTLSAPHAAVAFAVALLWLWPATSQAWSYKEAAAPYAGQSITVLDEVTPLQETMQKLVPQFEEETGIDVDYQLLNHFEVINRGQADLLSGRGEYDAIMVHSPQMGLLLDAGVLQPIDDMIAKRRADQPRPRPRRPDPAELGHGRQVPGRDLWLSDLGLQRRILGTRRSARASGGAGRVQGQVRL